MASVSVSNRGERFVGRFDGREFVFENMEAVVISDRAAAFFFGYQQNDATRAKVLVRNGWQRNSDPASPEGPDAAKKRLQSFVFRAAVEEERAKPQAKVLNPQVVTSAAAINIPGKSAPLAPVSAAAAQATA